jgi:polysaccharide export outer membrane protein
MESDSFLDPSVIGRWEHTPTVVPILDRIDSIEGLDAEYVEPSEPTPEDLVPVAVEYAMAPGDAIQIRVRDLVRVGSEELLDRVIDQKGQIDLPKVGQVRVAGLTPSQANTAIANAIITAQIITRDPVVSVTLQTSRRQTFSAFGQVNAPGTYLIPESNYRLLEALTAAGGWAENAPYVFVIRQAALADEAGGLGSPMGTNAPAAPSNPMSSPAPAPSATPAKSADDLMKVIDDLSSPQPKKPSPGVVRGSSRAGTSGRAQPGKDGAPPIDLEDASAKPARTEATGGTGAPPADGGKFNWIYVNGQWVKAAARDTGTPGAGGGMPSATGENRADDLVTQRVIRIPMEPLISGNAKYNIVVRPGDVLRIPGSGQGFIYMGGQIARPGSYGLPSSGRLTLQRAVDAAGGLGGIAIPERVDLTRMLPGDRQATIRLNLRAIAEQTQPDIYLKPDDRVNIGTNFWAFPLAVLRGGFRVSYGFGFLLDRNFGSDVFGAPPDSSNN